MAKKKKKSQNMANQIREAFERMKKLDTSSVVREGEMPKKRKKFVNKKTRAAMSKAAARAGRK